MEDAHLKFRFIYARFLVILFSFTVVYSFLHWLLVLRLGVIDINENIVIWGPPALLPLIPLWIWLRKRIRLLNLQSKKDNLFFNYLLMAHVAVAATTIGFQYYLISATGELVALKIPEEITDHKPVKYYTIGQYYADKGHARLQRFSYTSGKSKRTLNYELVIAAPLYGTSKDTLNSSPVRPGGEVIAPPTETGAATPVKIGTISSSASSPGPAIWVCLYYKTSLSKSSSPSYKEAAWETFYEECIQDFNTINLHNFIYLDRPGNSRKRDLFVQTVNGLNYHGTRLPNVMEPRYEPFTERSYGSLGWTVLLFVAGAGIWWLMILYKYFDEDALQKFMDERDNQPNENTFRGYI